MEVLNAVITNVAIELSHRGSLMANVILKTKDDEFEWRRRLSEDGTAHCLERFLHYTGVKTIEEMEGKIVRVTICHGALYGFAHPINDSFVPMFGDKVGWQFTPITFKEMLEEYLKNESCEE